MELKVIVKIITEAVHVPCKEICPIVEGVAPVQDLQDLHLGMFASVG
jgi:hypothetical protein